MGTPPKTKTDSRNQPPVSDWDRVAANSEFRDLMAAKARFIVPATLFFVAYYFALPILVGYAPELMSKPVWGPVNIAYLFALSQFFMAWIVAWLYMRAASRFDRMANNILAHLSRQKENDKENS
jgi:uncharacterized membrane protein (DUF485 family)